MVKLATVRLNTEIKFTNRDAEKLRGFMGSLSQV